MCSIPSGTVPGTDEEGHGGGPLYSGGGGGPDGFFQILYSVFSAKDYFLFSLLVDVLYVICTPTRDN
jgi:hypothetical protein